MYHSNAWLILAGSRLFGGTACAMVSVPPDAFLVLALLPQAVSSKTAARVAAARAPHRAHRREVFTERVTRDVRITVPPPSRAVHATRGSYRDLGPLQVGYDGRYISTRQRTSQ